MPAIPKATRLGGRPAAEPVVGLLSKQYAKQRFAEIDPERNRLDLKPGDPYPFQGEQNPFADLLAGWPPAPGTVAPTSQSSLSFEQAFRAGTTSVVAADAEGWVVSMTPVVYW